MRAFARLPGFRPAEAAASKHTHSDGNDRNIGASAPARNAPARRQRRPLAFRAGACHSREPLIDQFVGGRVIEQALYFALGFCVAGLIALGLAPAVWARALRLTRRRVELQTPLDAREAAADRDHVRAEAALAVRRAEQALAAERARRADTLAESGRKSADLAAARDRGDALAADLAARQAELRQAIRDAHEAVGTQGAYAQMTQAAEALRDRKELERADAARAHDAMAALAESRRIAIATLETRLTSDVAALEAANDAADRLRAALTERTREAAALADERAFLKEELARAEASRQQLAARHAAQTDRLAQIEAELAAARDGASRLEGQLLRGREATDSAAAQAEELRAALDAARARLKEHGEIAHERERGLSDRLEEARAEAAALRGALEEARRARAAPHPAAPHPAAPRLDAPLHDLSGDGVTPAQASTFVLSGELALARTREADAALRALIERIGRATLGEPPRPAP